MPYIAIIYLSALAKRSNEPLRELAARFTSAPFDNGRGTYRLAELVLSKSPTKKISPRPPFSKRLDPGHSRYPDKRGHG